MNELELEDIIKILEGFTERPSLELKNKSKKLKLSHEKFDQKWTILKSSLEKMIKEINKLSFENTTYYNDNYFEVLIKLELDNSPRRYRYHDMINQGFSLNDTSNQIRYTISKASDNYMVTLLNKVITETDLTIKELTRLMPSHILQRRISENDNLTFFDFMKLNMPYLNTLKIESSKFKSLNDFNNFCNSFLFQISYNLNMPILEVKTIDEVFSPRKLAYSRIRGSKIEDIEVPKRKYSADLLYHYQMALSSESPFLKYISFYHILEHFFEKIYHDDLVESLQDKITRPDFSHKKEKDINELIKLISKKLKVKNDTYDINEQEALELTIKQHVDINNILNILNSIDSNLIDYYKNTEVSFSKGKRVDLSFSNHDKIFENLARRIYQTRNSIVHSKESDKSKYIPFRDDKELDKEVILMRYIAEEVLIATSEEL
jgi:hypothetical protein